MSNFHVNYYNIHHLILNTKGESVGEFANAFGVNSFVFVIYLVGPLQRTRRLKLKDSADDTAAAACITLGFIQRRHSCLLSYCCCRRLHVILFCFNSSHIVIIFLS